MELDRLALMFADVRRACRDALKNDLGSPEQRSAVEVRGSLAALGYYAATGGQPNKSLRLERLLNELRHDMETAAPDKLAERLKVYYAPINRTLMGTDFTAPE